MTSFLMIDAGTVHVGLKLIDWMWRHHCRRWTFLLADDRDIAAGDLPLLEGLDGRRRDVHDDVALAEREARAGEPLRRTGELARPHVGRHIEGVDRPWPDKSCLGQAVAALE